MSNKNVKTILLAASEGVAMLIGSPNGFNKRKLSSDQKYYRMSNKPLGDEETAVNYGQRQQHSNILEFLSNIVICLKLHVETVRMANTHREGSGTQRDDDVVMQEKVCESSYYDEKDPDIQFLQGILNKKEDNYQEEEEDV